MSERYHKLLIFWHLLWYLCDFPVTSDCWLAYYHKYPKKYWSGKKGKSCFVNQPLMTCSQDNAYIYMCFLRGLTIKMNHTTKTSHLRPAIFGKGGIILNPVKISFLMALICAMCILWHFQFRLWETFHSGAIFPLIFWEL